MCFLFGWLVCLLVCGFGFVLFGFIVVHLFVKYCESNTHARSLLYLSARCERHNILVKIKAFLLLQQRKHLANVYKSDVKNTNMTLNSFLKICYIFNVKKCTSTFRINIVHGPKSRLIE